jgi:hypothetical protein
LYEISGKTNLTNEELNDKMAEFSKDRVRISEQAQAKMMQKGKLFNQKLDSFIGGSEKQTK